MVAIATMRRIRIQYSIFSIDRRGGRSGVQGMGVLNDRWQSQNDMQDGHGSHDALGSWAPLRLLASLHTPLPFIDHSFPFLSVLPDPCNRVDSRKKAAFTENFIARSII